MIQTEGAPAASLRNPGMEKPMIQATIRMAVPPQKSDAVLGILRSVLEHCRDNPRCLSSHLYADLQERNVLMLDEVWSAQEDLDHHLRSDEFRNLLLALELAVKRPEIKFNVISTSTGIETIEKARGQA
jgi:quinol monooxygenase YgiN